MYAVKESGDTEDEKKWCAVNPCRYELGPRLGTIDKFEATQERWKNPYAMCYHVGEMLDVSWHVRFIRIRSWIHPLNSERQSSVKRSR